MAVGDFPDGATATHKDGRKIVFKNGEWHVAPGSTATANAGGKVTEAERKASSFLTRALGANTSYEKQKVGPRGLVGQNFRDTFPNASNYLASDEQQVADTAQDEFIAASLRQDSGAAIPEEELERQRRIYFPMPGDGEAAIKAKAAARERAIQGLLASAGNGVDEKLKAQYPSFFNPEGGDQASGAAGATGGSGTPPTDPNGPGAGKELVFNDQMPTQSAAALPLTDEQKSGLQAIAQSGGGAAQIMALARSYGTNISQENADALAKFYADPKNRNIVPVVNEDRTVRPVDPGDGVLGRGTVGATAQGIANAATLGFFDEGAALVDTVAQGGTYADNLDRRRGMELYDEQNSPVARGAGQIIGSLPLGGVEFAGGRAAALAAGKAAVRSGASAAEARVIANQVFAQRTALEAAGISGVYGAGEADGGLSDRVVNAGLGAAVGAAGGYALARGGSRFARALAARKGGGGLTPQQEALTAAERQNVVPFLADVGGPGTRRITAAVSQTMAGAGPIRRGAEATLDSAEAVRNRVATSIGTPVDNEMAGEAAIQGSRAFIARTGQRIGRIYDAAAQAGGQAKINATEAVRVLDGELGPLRESPIQGPGVAILEGLRDALDRPQTVRGLREARTQLRDQFESTGLRGSNIQRIADRVVDAATDDLVNGLRAQGLDRAATQYRVADRLWKQRLEVIDDTLEPIIKNKSGEQVVKALQSSMQGNNRRFETFLKALPPAEQSTVRASLVQRLGRATAGGQDQGGEVFSLNTFLSNWNNIGSRAKTALFGDDGRAALNDLATYAAQARESQRYANASNTGGVVANLSAIWNFSTLGTALVAEGVGARVLASPAVARWLARAPKQRTPEAVRTHLARLSRIARAEPAIASEVLALQQHLADALPALPSRVAANEGPQERAPVQGEARNGATANQRLQP